MPSFKVPCPSCEAPVLIKNPDLVGKKVECPKCKYRFKVEEPAAPAAPAAGGAATATDTKKTDAKTKKADAKKTKATGTKNKKLVPILVGVGAVVILAVVYFAAFGGSGGGKKGGGGGGGGSGGGGGGGGGGDDVVVPPPEVKKEGPPPAAFSKANTTNLLPAGSVAVYRFNMDRVRESPAHAALVDSPIRALFQGSMGFDVDEVDAYFHCIVGEQTRDPFGVIRLKTPVKPPELTAMVTTARSRVDSKPNVVNKKWNLYAVRSNPFVAAVGHALAMRSLLSEVYDRTPMNPTAPPAKLMGVCVYDTQHVLLGDYALMEKFLGSLDADGYPPFKTVMNTPVPVSAPVTDPAGMPGMTPAAPPAVPPAAPPTTPAAPPAGDRPFTSIDAYRTIEPPMKKALDTMEADKTTPPLLVYAEKFDAKHYDPKLMKPSYEGLSTVLDPIAERTIFLSANVITFTQRQLVANLRITLSPNDDPRPIAKDQLAPGLTAVASVLRSYLVPATVEFRDYTAGGTATNAAIPPSTGPGMVPGTGPGPMGGPGSLGPPPGVGPGPGKPGSGSSLGPPAGVGPPPGMGSGPGPGKPGSGSSLGPPAGVGPPIGMGPEMPPGSEIPGGGEDPNNPEVRPPAVSHVDLGLVDNQLLIGIDLTWTESVYRTKIAPTLVSVTNQIKGKMAVFSSEFSWHVVAAAGPTAMAASEKKAFPRGTADRRANIDRFGLEYPPSTRVSLFAELLPYLGRDTLAKSLRKDLAWYDPHNLPAPGNDRAGAWVPELLVPDYPQSAWRATSPLAPEHVLGATNYVAIAGSGLNIAREDLKDPKVMERYGKKVGITGYGWGSKAEEVTDGLSNTIYMMQTPPGLQQPWIAGGGATVRGLDEVDPMAAFKYTQAGRTKQGSYALMGDNSVRFIPADIDPKVLLAMSTRAGGETLADINTHAPPVIRPKPVEVKPEEKKEPDPKPPEDKKPEDKKPEDKKPEDKKPDAKPEEKDKKPADPKKEPEPAPKGKEPPKVEPAPAPTEKKG